jgi:hypothetical protein
MPQHRRANMPESAEKISTREVPILQIYVTQDIYNRDDHACSSNTETAQNSRQ